ncbi:Disease resistance protein RPM1 [Zea mays]|uniref:Disease resistance protein RPM1 n=1 Tax=Zea mays TaxID=4577 RepID=A0A1D6L8L0_MAIZE|nr:Disease resistance protein RPM1 [Zea mays]
MAVKLLHSMAGLDDKLFEEEFHNIARLQHKNIVRLVGFCHETQRQFIPHDGKMIFADSKYMALCFEYMHNGSLDKFIIDENSVHDWSTRYAIIKGICEGLKYLHEELNPPIYHLDLKPANILLDDNMMPKLADFGLSKIFEQERTRITQSCVGTHGYLPPEYIDRKVISNKLDIFSLGVIIIKIISGPTGYTQCAEMPSKQFVELVHEKWRNKLQTTMDAAALETYCEQVVRCIEMALSCVETDRHKRPSIGAIIDELNKMETNTDQSY